MFRLIALICLLICVTDSKSQQIKCDNMSGIAEKIMHLHYLKFDWMKSRQTDSLSMLMDDQITYVHSNGWEETKEDVISNIKNKKLVYHDVIVESCHAKIFSNVIIVTGQGNFKVSLDEKYIEISLKYTETYACLDGRIKLINRHANKLN